MSVIDTDTFSGAFIGEVEPLFMHYYDDVNAVWMTNGISNYRWRGGNLEPMHLPAPEHAPSAYAELGGELEGSFLVLAAFQDADGEISAYSPPTRVDVPSGHSLRILHPVAPPELNPVIFISRRDSERIFKVDLDAGDSTLVSSVFGAGSMMTGVQLSPIPAGHLITGMGGRIYIARDDTLYFTEPYRAGLYEPGVNEIRFRGRIRILNSVEGVIVVGDDEGLHVLHGADPTDFKSTLVYDGEVIGYASLTTSAMRVGLDVPGRVVVCMTRDGIGYVSSSGDVILPQQGNFIPNFSRTIQTAIGDNNGIEQIIFTTD
jgi:hypothetical protein